MWQKNLFRAARYVYKKFTARLHKEGAAKGLSWKPSKQIRVVNVELSRALPAMIFAPFCSDFTVW